MSSMRMGGSTLSNNLLNGKGKLRWCIREKSKHQVDNGWVFLSDVDTNEFLSNPKNMSVCDFGTIFEIEPAVLSIFDMPVGTELTFVEREDGSRDFYHSKTGKKVIFDEEGNVKNPLG